MSTVPETFTLVVATENEDDGCQLFSIASKDLTPEEINEVSHKGRSGSLITSTDELLWQVLYPKWDGKTEPEPVLRMRAINGGTLIEGPIIVLYCMSY